MSKPSRIDGYAIISGDGMIANAAGVMPSALKFEADQQFFERGLDAVDVVVHGRNSKEQQARSAFRRRLILTRRIPSIAMKSGTQNALFWNPTGAPLEQAMKVLGVPNGSIGVIGGTEVFALFLDRYDTFYLTRAPGVQIPGGQPVFPEVPRITPEDVLSQHGLSRGERQVLDAKSGLVVVSEVTPRGYRVMVLCLTVSYENARTKSLSLWFEPLNSTRRANRLAPRAEGTV